MSWFKDLRIGTKLVTAFCVVAVIAGIVGWIGVTTTKDALALQKQIYERNLVPIQTLGDISLRFQDLRVALRDVLLTDGDADRTRKSSEAVEMLYRKVNEDLTSFEAAGLLKFADQKEVYSKLMPDLKTYAEYKDRILTAARDLKSISAAKKNAVGAKEGNFAVFMSITLTVVGMILAIVLGLFMSRLISRPVQDLAKKAERVAEGDLMVDVTASSRDEIGQLSESFARMIESLRTLIGQVGSASDHLASAATELTSNSEQITAGAQEVASQSGAVASAGEEMAATSKDIARNCQVAVKEGKEASDAAQTGVEVVNRTVEVMGRIADRVHETARTIEDLGSRSHQIGAMIQAIQEGTKSAVNEVTGQVHQVATAAEEQTATTSEISSNMLRISNVVQQTADGARESTASSNQLAKLADDLQRLIGKFRIAA